MIKYVYNKEIETMNREPIILDVHPYSEDMNWYAIYFKIGRYVMECHVKAYNIEQALGIFFMEYRDITYNKVIEHLRLD